MTHYPVFLNLRGRRVVVVGGGPVAVRKAKGLLEAGALVTVIAPEVLTGLPIQQKVRKYRPGDLKGAVLAFTATNDRAVNAQVTAEANKRRIPVNVADAPDEGDFIVPARVRRGRIQIAISTGGESPRLAKQLREKLESVLPDVRT
ncbi:MAG: bifunctional precorrin-2 dehydrogenase/sirohydrochlorin ferrochelatase [Acidobacteria bacterium]|nr:bifunctional precorrin-2 dehydrogenase/sirohydrochlorin ferrochelatase [Acidobacteriota bacterium]